MASPAVAARPRGSAVRAAQVAALPPVAPLPAELLSAEMLPAAPLTVAPLTVAPVPAAPERPAEAARFRWPVDGRPHPVRRFDPPPRPWLPGHRGVDLLAPAGATIRAAGTGTVLFAGVVAGRPVISVVHPDGLRTTYEPVSPDVTVGTSVAAGTALGTLLPGHAGCPEAACLHWGLRRGDDYLDPLALLGLGRSRLLPLDPEPPAATSRPDAVSVGRAGWAAGRRAARTRPASCTPARRAATIPVRRRS
ncbi:M23 family metallopeptidase [Micromonospora sp. NPDC047793]|uniref:M23 family metallopeptidase n=1 Tax=Micromonospora sp. NPDC047793 TaxID=3154342 RepID=UPI0033F85A52